jgi:Zn-dependent protease
VFLRRAKLFTLAGFTVWIDASWLILAVLVTWTLAEGIFPASVRGLSAASYWWMAVAGAIGLFASIIIHELSHSLVARRFSLPIAGITLFIFGGVAELHHEPASAKSEFLVAAVGPLTSFILGAVFFAVAVLGGALPAPMLGVASYLGTMNWALALFNLVPAFPLDGGRILRAALWAWRKDLGWATNIAAKIGAAFGIVLILGGGFEALTGNFVGGVWLFLIGMFLHGASGATAQQMLARRVFAGRPVSSIMVRDPVTVPPDVSVRVFVEDFVHRHHHRIYPVVEVDQIVGCMKVARLREVDRADWDHLLIRDLLERCSPDNTTGPATDALEALARMQRSGNKRLLIVADGRLQGIVSLSDMLRILSLERDLGGGPGRQSAQTARDESGARLSHPIWRA